MYSVENMKPHWFSKETVYNYSNNITAGVYAFAWCQNKPDDNIWPFMLEETFYIGMSGGLNDDYIGDKKNKDKSKIMLTTAFHQRIKRHMHRFGTPDNKTNIESKKYNRYHEHYSPMDTYDKQLYISILTPLKHVKQANMRNTLSVVEHEQIYLYSKQFELCPLLNLAESNDVSESRKNKNSHSQLYVTELKKNSLIRFMD